MLIMNHILCTNIGVIEVPDRAAAVVTNSADDTYHKTGMDLLLQVVQVSTRRIGGILL
jgi:hypothetical protein